MQADQRRRRVHVSEHSPAERLREQLDAPRRRAARPNTDNGVSIAQLLERGALVLVPLMVFLLFAYAVISPR